MIPMSEENRRLDQAEALVDLKTVEAAIVKRFDDMNAVVKRVEAERAELGAAQADTLGKLESISKEYNQLFDRVQQIEQKRARMEQNAETYNVGAMFAEFDGVKAMTEGRAGRARMEIKAAIINARGPSQPLVQADRLGGIYTTPNRVLQIRDVLPSSTTDSNLVEYTRENVFTNSAGPTVAGSPEQYENVTKPESGITFTLVSAPVVTLAHWIPASRQVLDDSASLASHINGRLIYGLKLKEETQLLSGTGINHQLNGLLTQATAFVQTSPENKNEIDIIRMAIKQAHVAEYRPDFAVLNPQDWFDIEIRKVGTSDARYVVGDPGSMGVPNLWGLPIVVTNSIASGKFLIGSAAAAEIKDRQMAAVEMSREDGTNFQKNMVTILAEERLTLCVYRTEAFIKGDL
jgi:HK97 family phage major capsid protein